jgi:hypothetical protein
MCGITERRYKCFYAVEIGCRSAQFIPLHIHVNVLTLLWEIKRLRTVVLQADQLQRSLSSVGGGAGTVLELLPTSN